MSTSRKIKNVIKNYNDSQRKVRDATSNDPWGPASSTMSEIADLTYNVVAFTDIMDMIWRRINDKGKNWRHVYKALVLLDYIIKTGSERVAQQCKEKIVDINTLKDFRFYDANNQDVGRNVREKSKQIVELLKNEERLKSERVAALKAKERFAQANQGIGSNTRTDTFSSSGSASTPTSVSSSTPPPTRNLTSEIEQARPQTTNEEELQLQLALAMSKEEAEQERQQQKNERIRLEMAINESLDETSLDPTQPQLASDPWAVTPVVPAAAAAAPPPPPPQQPQNDPWAPLAAPPPLQAPAPAADPWAPTLPTVQPVADPWGSPAPVPAAAPASVPQNDPWAPPSASQPKDPDSEFDLLRSTTTTTTAAAVTAPTQPSSNGNLFGGPPLMPSSGPTGAGAFDLTGMQETLFPEKPSSKKPEDFLGENSSLVNLDALVGPPKPAQLMPQAPNPFLSAGISGGMSAPQSNPFQQQRPPAPTINQMRAEPMMSMSQQGGMYAVGGGGFSGAPPMMGGGSLPPPLIPLSSGSSSNQIQPQQANNPFLL